MDDKYIVFVDFEFNVHNTQIRGQLHLPYINGQLYKIVKAIVIEGGYVCDAFTSNKGKGGEKNRNFKKRIIEKYCSSTPRVGVYKIKKPFSIDDSSIGIVSLAGKFSGYNTNKHTDFYLLLNDKKIKAGLALKKLIACPSTYKDDLHAMKYINMEELFNKDKTFRKKIIEGEWNEKG